MQFSLPSATLLTALESVAQCAAKQSTIPALQNVKCAVTDDALTLTAHDASNGIGARYSLPIIPLEPGSCILPLSHTLAILKEHRGDISLSATADAVTIVTDGARYDMLALPVDDFPDLDAPPSSSPFTLAASSLRALFSRTHYAADKKDTTAKFALQGIRLVCDGTALRYVATDTKRLAVHAAPLLAPIPALPPQTLPLRALTLLDRNLPDDDTAVTVDLAESGATFSCECFTLHTAYLSGSFPPWERILSKLRNDSPLSFTLPAAEFAAKVRQSAIMSDDESKRIDCEFTSSHVTLRARGAAKGSSEVSMLLSAAPLSVAFDPSYLTDFFASIKGADSATVTAKDGRSQVLFSCGETQCLIMPLTG